MANIRNISSNMTLGDFAGPVAMIAAVAGAGFLGASGNKKRPSASDPWYRGMKKSPLNPPDFVFGIVWPLLYITLAIALAGLMRVRRPSAVFSAVSRMIAITSVGFSPGLAAKSFAARLATLGEAMDVPDRATREPPGRKLSTW